MRGGAYLANSTLKKYLVSRKHLFYRTLRTLNYFFLELIPSRWPAVHFFLVCNTCTCTCKAILKFLRNLSAVVALAAWPCWNDMLACINLCILGLCDHPTPHCWLLPECELNSLDEHSRSRHHKHGTLSLLTLDPALLYRYLNAISKPTFSLILNRRHKRLCIPRRTLWRYTNVVLLLLLLFCCCDYSMNKTWSWAINISLFRCCSWKPELAVIYYVWPTYVCTALYVMQ